MNILDKINLESLDIFTVGGIVCAGLMILLGLVLIFRRKPNPPTPSDAVVNNTAASVDATEQIDLFSHIPLETTRNNADDFLPLANVQPAQTKTNNIALSSVDRLNINSLDDDDFPLLGQPVKTSEINLQPNVKPAVTATPTPTPTMPNISSARSNDSALLDHHLELQMNDDSQTSLAQAEQVISLYLLPKKNKFVGDKLLKAFKDYGLRFGEMSLFHRFEHTDGTGNLMFSVLQYTDENGAQGFDLETLVQDDVEGLAFFLGLPHIDAVRCFDFMMHAAESLSKTFDANLFDEDMNVINRISYEKYRQQVSDYQG